MSDTNTVYSNNMTEEYGQIYKTFVHIYGYKQKQQKQPS